MRKTTLLLLLLLMVWAFAARADAQIKYRLTTGTTTYSALSGSSAFSWTETTANDEGYSASTDIGFSFTYNGTIFTQFQVSTNGFLKLGTGLAAASAPDSLSGTLRNVLAPLWDDLAVSNTASDITYKLSGISPNRILTVEWNKVKWNKTAASANAQFQVKLYENDGHFEFIYGTMGTPTTGSASIGISDGTTITTAGSATGKFLSVNVGGASGSRVYHQSMSYTFNGINTAPDANTIFTFTPVVPAAITAGTYTIGGSSPSFSSFSDAAISLNLNGISGPVVLNVRTGTYDDVFHLLEVAGASSTNTILLTKESGSVTLSPSNGSQSTSAPGASAGDAIIRFDGAKYVTIDGLTLTQNANNNTNIKKFNMGISLNNSVLNGVPISGSQYNTFKNISIDLGGGAVTGGLIGVRFGTAGTGANTFAQTNSCNTIQDINITGFFANAIKLFGHSATLPDSLNKITAVTGRNTIGNVIGTIGSDMRIIEMDCQSTVTIEKTDIVNVSNTANTTNNIYGIVTNLLGNPNNLNRGKFIIRDNKISSLINSATTVTTGFASAISLNTTSNNTAYDIYKNTIFDIYTNGSAGCRASGILLNVSTCTNMVANVYDNNIYNIRAPRSTSGPSVRGLDMQNGGGTGVFNLYNNTVYLDNSVPTTATNHQSACLYFANMSTSSLDLRNNIFINTMATNGTGRAVVLYASANSNLLRLAATTNNNLYYAGITGTTRGVSTDVANIYQTLAQHQAAVATGGLGGPRDVNSIYADATSSFVSSTSPYDLHIKSNDWVVNGQGVPTSLVTTDLDGNERSTSLVNGPVDLGAYEITPTEDASTSVSGAIGDGQTTTFKGVDGKTIATIQWNGASATFPGSVALNYTPGKRPIDNSGNTLPRGIDRMFTFTPDVAGSGWTANVTLYYNSTTEIRNYPEANLRVNQRPISGTGDWTVYPTTISTATHTAAFTTTSLGTFSCDGAPASGVVFDGTLNASEWGSPLVTSDGGPTPGFGAGHEINALYYLPDNTSTDSLYFGLAGNVQNGNKILIFIDSKSGGYNTANFDRTNAPAGIKNFNSGSTFDADFYPDYCLVIGTNSTHDNYFYDLFTLSTSGTNKYLGDNTTIGLYGSPANSDITKGFEFRIAKSDLGYNGGAIKVFAAYISEGGYLSNQFLAHANPGEGNYTDGAVIFSAAAPNPITLPASILPVELTTFTSSVKNNAVTLNWQTATEKSNYGFEVERSSDKTKWTKVGFVNGNGNSNSPKNYSYIDKSSITGVQYYRLKQIDTDGKYEYSKIIEVNLGLPKTYELSQNYPNPFNPATTIKYALPENQVVKLTIFNSLGEEVAKLVNGYMEAGTHEVKFDAGRLASGIYFYRLEAGKYMQTRKMMLIK